MTRLPMLKGCIQELVANGDGIWRTCSGCYETSDGQNVHGYPHSDTFGCILGSGCCECGGIGAVWDTTDYEQMGRGSSRDPEAAKLEMLREQLVRAVDLLERVSGQEFANVARVSREVLAEVQGDAALKGAAE